MSGIELAGLVLGAFPIVVKAMSSYAEGCQKVGGMFRYEKELKAFQLEILTEYTKFYNTCEQLLQDLAVSEDIKQLIKPESPAKGKEGWSSANVRQALARKLNKSTADVFLQNVEAMNEVIEELMRDFPSDEGTKPSSRKQAKKVMKGIGFKLLESMHQQKIQKMERINANLIVLSSGGHRPHNSSMPESTRQAKKAVELYRLIRDHAVGVLYALKEKLDPLACPCHAPHDSGLRLEVRDLEIKPQSMKDGFGVRFRTYISVQDTSSGINWREVDVEAVDANGDGADAQTLGSETKQGLDTTDAVFSVEQSTPTWKNNGTTTTGLGVSSPSNDRPRSPLSFMGKQVAKLGLISNKRASFLRSGEAGGDSGITCSASSTIIVQPKPRVSFLFDDCSVPQRSDAKSSSEDLPLIDILCCQLLAGCTPPKLCYGQLSCSMPRHMRLCLWQPQCETVFTAHQAPQLTTLHDLLTRKRRCGIPLRQRLQLGLKLASSVLQLYSSGWLPASWSSKDIVFFEDGNGVKIEHPMVRNAESRPGKTRQTKPQTPRRTDESLLSLGIVLIELYYGWTLAKCVEENIEPDSQGVLATFTNNPLDEQIRHDWADALVDNLYDDAGDDYGEAVRRCIRGLDHRESSLTKDAVKVKMYQDVIGPLKIVEGFYAEKIS